MKLITVCTDTNNYYYKNWLYTANKHNHDVVVLGSDIKWTGFKLKNTLVYNYCTEHHDPDELIVVVDSYDLFVQHSPETLKKRFELSGRPKLIFGIENTICLPYNCIHLECNADKHKYTINGGFIMGKASDLAELYKFVLKNSPWDDQLGFSMYRNINCGPDIHMDISHQFVANIIAFKDKNNLQVNNDEALIRYKGSDSVFLHTPFIYAEFGYRYNKIGKHLLPNTFERKPVLYWIKGFINHIYKVGSTHPSIKKYVLLSIVLVTVVIIVAIVSIVILKNHSHT